MARARRTKFAAPFVVVVVAGGCSKDGKGGDPKPPKPQLSWSVHRDGDRCVADQRVECPPPSVRTCNPPPPMYLRCPPEVTDASFEIVSFDGQACFLADGKTAIACPTWEPPPPPAIDAGAAAKVALREWTIARKGDACEATDDPCSRLELPPGAPIPPCNPPAPQKLACPPAGVVAIVETAPGTCETRYPPCDPGVKCNPPSPSAIACPP